MYGGVGLMLLLFVFLQTGEAQTGAAIAVRLSAPEAAASPATVAMWPGQESRQVAIPGEAVFDELAAGEYRIEVTADGFAPRDTTVRVEPGERVPLSLTLRPVAVTLAEVTVETPRNGTEHIYQRAQIAASAAQTLPDFLRQTAGLDVRSDGTAGSPVTARVGGSAANQVLVLVDGRRVQQVGSGEADLAAIPLEWVESVKVVRGGRADAGGEAIGGILEVTTRTPAKRPELEVTGELHPTYDRVNLLRSGKTGPIASLLSFARTQGPGDFRYTITEDDGTGAFTVGLGQRQRRANADITRDQLLVKLGTPSGTATAAELSASLDRAARGMPGYLAPQLTPLARQATQQEALNLRLSRTGRTMRGTVRISLQHDAQEFTNPDVTALVKQAEERSGQAGGEAQFSARAGRAQLSGGAQATRETLASDQITGEQAARWRWAVWSLWRQPLLESSHRHLSLAAEPGLRYERFGGEGMLLPNVRLAFEHVPAFRYGAMASWGRSYRAPTFYALFWQDDQVARGNPTLLPETSTEWTGRVYAESAGGDRARVEVAASEQRVENLISWRRAFDNRWTPFNLKRAHVKTLDVTYEQRLWREHVTLSAGLNWTDARDATDDRNTGGKYLTFRAPHTQRAGLRLRSHGLDITLQHRRIAARPVLETNSKWLRAYEITDVQLAYAFHLRKLWIEPAVGIDNLFDEQYRIVRHAPMPGREVFARIHFSQR